VNFGIQEIQEVDFSITTEFVKRAGGDHGGDWTARITAQPNKKVTNILVSLKFHLNY
jgi:mannosyl-oligosaccharide glucosidase